VVRVAWYPRSVDLKGNPYWERLQEALEEYGIEFETSHDSYWMARRWLLAHRPDVDVLHFHFIQPQYGGSDERASLRRVLKFASDLILARLLGYRIVWTVHDLMPTWPKEPQWVERLARYTIAHLAHDVIVHCQEARLLVQRTFRRSRRVWVLPLPSYADAHPNDVSQPQARARLGIPAEFFVIGYIGGIRPNKGLEDLIAAFQSTDIDASCLLIAGRPWPPETYLDQIRKVVGSDPRIVLRIQSIRDEELQLFLNAADVFAFPFRQVLTSSSVILALSFGRPVIVPQMGCLPELVGSDAGIVYTPGNVKDLASAIEKARQMDLSAMGIAGAARANTSTWHDLANGTARIYRSTR
jgi:beta-1,4-mannosyltransferase